MHLKLQIYKHILLILIKTSQEKNIYSCFIIKMSKRKYLDELRGVV